MTNANRQQSRLAIEVFSEPKALLPTQGPLKHVLGNVFVARNAPRPIKDLWTMPLLESGEGVLVAAFAEAAQQEGGVTSCASLLSAAWLRRT